MDIPLFTEEDQINILTKLGYVVKPYSVDQRLRDSGMHAMVSRHTGYEVFENDKLIGNVYGVFKQVIIKRIFDINIEE